MPKAILSFKIPEEEHEFKTACAASDLALAIWNIKSYMRNLRKYDERDMIPKEEIDDAIHTILSELPELG
jgi:hypothetical protein